jgi:GNAT superfamily N-acetyltransferase
MGRRSVETVARHVASGRLVGFTHVQVTADRPHLAYQHDTLVLREHRGHRLGVRLKAANALALREAMPQVRTVRTWNAVDNAPMLAVNRALGYRPSGRETEWQKVLTG